MQTSTYHVYTITGETYMVIHTTCRQGLGSCGREGANLVGHVVSVDAVRALHTLEVVEDVECVLSALVRVIHVLTVDVRQGREVGFLGLHGVSPEVHLVEGSGQACRPPRAVIDTVRAEGQVEALLL